MFILLIIVILLAFIILFVSKIKTRSKPITLETYIQNRVSRGELKETIKVDLLKDLEEGGRLFGEFRNSIRATSNGVMNRLRDAAQWAEDLNVKRYRWIAVLVNTCSDCILRHGEVGTMKEWEERGLPRSGFSACKENCRCILVDADTTVLKSIKKGTPISSASERTEQL